MNSIIIPHRGREDYLYLCLASIEHSSRHCKGVDYEVIVANNGVLDDDLPITEFNNVRVVQDDCDMPVFNKSKLLNLGIEDAYGDVLTFLDCDAIVGEHWLGSDVAMSLRAPTRLCYRVKYYPDKIGSQKDQNALEEAALCEIYENKPIEAAFHWLFDKWNDLDQAWEGHGHPGINGKRGGKTIHGNSQFSITRENLGDLRFDERYCGKGMEDLDFNQQIFEKFGKNYSGYLDTRSDYGIIHLRHPYESDWKGGLPLKNSMELYAAKWGDVEPI
jgi:glycosyltransferase involved in cell wall biosynthesis